MMLQMYNIAIAVYEYFADFFSIFYSARSFGHLSFVKIENQPSKIATI